MRRRLDGKIGTNLVIRRHTHMGKRAVLAGLGAMLLVLLSWMFLDYGHWHFVYNRMKISNNTRTFAPSVTPESLPELQNQNLQLRDRVTVLERAAQVDKQSVLEVQTAIRNAQDEIFALKEELAFYQNMVSSARPATGLRIQNMSMVPTADPQKFRYRLVLTRTAGGEAEIKGVMEMSVTSKATAGHTEKLLRWADLDAADAAGKPFQFRHFLRLEGEITLPAGFSPARLNLTLKPQGDAPAVSQSYDWGKLNDS